jgi:cyclophilin family peptidyl-prolyl cis-trans isomerase
MSENRSVAPWINSRGEKARSRSVAAQLALVFGVAVMMLTACGGGGSDTVVESTPLQAAEATSDIASDSADTQAEDSQAVSPETAAPEPTASENPAPENTTPQNTTPENTGTAPSVVMRTTLGDIEIQLDAEQAPITVANFLNYVDEGHYQQAIFHRVIAGFMVQGGGFTADYQRLATEDPIINEANNGLDNDRYTIAMARTSNAHSATDQFFINVADNAFLNYTAPIGNGWGYAVFGRVVDGFKVVDQIESVTTGAAGPFGSDVPVEPVIILGVERL